MTMRKRILFDESFSFCASEVLSKLSLPDGSKSGAPLSLFSTLTVAVFPREQERETVYIGLSPPLLNGRRVFSQENG